MTTELAARGAPPAYDHVVIVVEENHSYTQITSTFASAAPYINKTLIGEGASFTKAFGEEHLSEGNYLWLFSGSNHAIGFADPCPVGPFADANLGASLIGAGHSFKGYSEDLPDIGSTVCSSGAYARKHNPWVNFSNVPNGATADSSSNLRFSDFPADYSTLPTVSFVIPNQNNDMHNGANPATIATGDAWLHDHLDGYYQWAKTHNSLLIVTFDENSTSTQGLTNPATGANRIATVFAGAGVAHGSYAEGAGITHVNMLRTLEDMYGLPHAGAQQSLATVAGIGDGPISDIYTQWDVDASGDWFAATNWNKGVVPYGPGAVASLHSAISAPQTITIDAPLTLSVLNIDNANRYTLAGGSALMLDAAPDFAARVNVTSGSHVINAPLALAANTRFNVATGSELTISDLGSSNVAITKTGGGTVRVNRVRAESLQVVAGTLAVLPNATDAGTSRLHALHITGGETPTAAVDLADNALVIDYDADATPLATIQNQVISGYANGYWNGPGINSSSAAADLGYAVGYAESIAVLLSFPATFMGQEVDDTSLLIRYTRDGDANLDGAVDLLDFNRLALNFGESGKLWSDGDFNYDGAIDLLDFNLLAGNFGLSAGTDGIVDPADWAALAAVVPEPTAIRLLFAAILPLSAARRRRGDRG